MEIDIDNGNEGMTNDKMEIDANGETVGREEDNGYGLRLVAPDESGEGLPYAPQNWPNPGDVWRWKVGKRVSAAGTFLDRYLYLPKSLRNGSHTSRKTYGFASKLSVERYIQTRFPHTNLDAFFASFSWKIPAEHGTNGKLKLKYVPVTPPPFVEAEEDLQSGPMCKARNTLCLSLLDKAENTVAVMECDICCSESKFCRDCCCILCSKAISFSYGGYDYIRCEAMTGEGSICGHAAHTDCALRCYMAGTVGGSIGLDTEYYCRRCDARTDLVSHVTRLLHVCESLESRDTIAKILNIGICILRGSEKVNANELLQRIEVAITKLQNGTPLEDIWKEEDNFSAISSDVSHHESTAVDIPNFEEPLNRNKNPDLMSASFDYRTESGKLGEVIDQVLYELKKSQESEYRIAEETLHAQKTYLCNLYQQLEKEKADLARRTSTDPDTLLSVVLSRVKQIKRERAKLRDMEGIGIGFGKTSKAVLKTHFSVESEE